MVVGASDSGKSTLAHWLFGRLCARGRSCPAFLDGDPGQSILGPPATMTLLLRNGARPGMSRADRRLRWFVGSTTPRNHEPRLLTGVAHLVEAARSRGRGPILYDTTGFVDPLHGGVALKLAKIDLLRPLRVIAIRRGEELEPLLSPLRRRGDVELVELDPVDRIRRRDTEARRLYRRRRFAAYFARASHLYLRLGRIELVPDSLPEPEQLLALESASGFTLALGIVTDLNQHRGTAVVLTPIRSLVRVKAIRVSGIRLNPATFEETRQVRPGPRASPTAPAKSLRGSRIG
jgi:polynucleotide 5'-hydroxyl-kinase GRC3/NOL9